MKEFVGVSAEQLRQWDEFDLAARCRLDGADHGNGLAATKSRAGDESRITGANGLQERVKVGAIASGQGHGQVS